MRPPAESGSEAEGYGSCRGWFGSAGRKDGRTRSAGDRRRVAPLRGWAEVRSARPDVLMHTEDVVRVGVVLQRDGSGVDIRCVGRPNAVRSFAAEVVHVDAAGG